MPSDHETYRPTPSAPLRSGIIPDRESLMDHCPTTAPPLNEREDQVLDYLITFLRDHGYQPSVREIATALQISSTKTVADVFRQLEGKGYIELLGFARGVRIRGLQIVVTRTLVPNAS